MGEPTQGPSSVPALMTEHEAQETSSLPASESRPFSLPDPDEFNGQFAILTVPSADFAFSRELVVYLYEQPAVLLRGLLDCIGFDKELFSSREIACTGPTQPVELRRQVKQVGHTNCRKNGEPTWKCLSLATKQPSTIELYTQYQAESFRSDVREGAKENVENVQRPDWIRFGTNIDLSKVEVWWEQWAELDKLPPFARVDGGQNFLSHVGYPLLGMNTIQLYMKVTGARTPGHQENNNFCSVNINIGPGDCEWFGVPNSHWKQIHDLCEENGLKYLSGSWWPNLEDLRTRGIPVIRVIQAPGDMIWINCGTVHWVQALGVCNNIAWNVGPVTVHQYEAAVERYRWNKLQKFTSIVPMIQLSWNVARSRSLRFAEQELVEDIKLFLEETLQQYVRDSEFLKQKAVARNSTKPATTDPAPYCQVCKVEVFGVFLVEEKGSGIHCIQCALKKKENLDGFLAWEQYSPQELIQTFKNFVSYYMTHSDPPSVD